ncbi:hypothetical protein [Catellatospora coxensis]|uniref:CRISPR-associated protein (TIGR02710 family) n=1 Tax=Catellatospora coxensis TaxID=310354 RepID=A0A8J3L7X2_9ACTN|nr:hypothetical protein [Catellatospora coxensis]GIG10779.1 hypothetical protein Cco03nite_74790 [Catellatospora coxensis]
MDNKRQRMRRIFRGEEPYGEGTAADQANRYRLEVIYPDAVESARRNSADVARPEVDLLISLSGFSPETTLLAYELLQPERLLIISSENTRAKVDLIYEKLRDRLTISNLELRYCDPVDPIDIYEIVKGAVRRRPGEPPRRAIIDITGGKKVMSAGAALAAAQLDLAMCYIDSDFDPEMRQALPGSERLCVLPNPTALFGDKDMAAAMAMFRAGLYSGARARFTELSDFMSEPARARFLGDLSALYQAWCDLDVKKLPELAEQLQRRLADPRSGVRTETAGRMSEQLAFVDQLVTRDGPALLLNFFLLGEHYLNLDRYDFAALLFYRTIEKAFAERLRLRFGFDPGQPDYSAFGTPENDLAERYSRAAGAAYGGPRAAVLPFKVALIDAMILLSIHQDELLSGAHLDGPKAVGSLRNLVDARNRSVLAHGEESVTLAQCQDLRSRAQAILRSFWRLHRPEEEVDKVISTLRFVVEA